MTKMGLMGKLVYMVRLVRFGQPTILVKFFSYGPRLKIFY